MSLRFSLLTVGLLTLGVVVSGQPAPPLVAPTGALSPVDEAKGFTLPEGYVVQLVASEPDIFKPMNLSFDYQGRIWLTDSLEYPWAAKDGEKPRDSVKILSNFGPDGRAGKIQTFADGLNIPIGLLPLPSKKGEPTSALVHGIPNVWKITDTDGDSKADKREPLLTGFGFRDTHGMTNSFQLHWDGWIHATHGFANDSEIKSPDGTVLKLNSGNTYRYLPDGKGLQSYTRGQVNPFGMTVDEWGNFYTADCHSKPIYQLLPGAIYPSFAKPHDGMGFGPDMIKHTHHSTGICGIAILNDESFPPEHRGSVVIGNVVTSKVNHDVIDRKGATPNAVEQPDFITSKDLWFRPVDIKLGPDGALYILDFYNKIIGHYEVPLTHPGRDRHRGRVWKVFYAGKDGRKTPPSLPNFQEMAIPELVDALSSSNLTKRIMAGHMLVRHGGESVGMALRKVASRATAKNEVQCIHANWALLRLGALDKNSMAELSKDSSALVRAHAAKMIAASNSMDESASKILGELLKDENSRVRHAAIQSIGRLPSGENLRQALSFRLQSDPSDSHLYHSARLALRDQLREPATWAGLPANTTKREELVALADVALGIPGEAPAAFLAGNLAAINPQGDREVAMVRWIMREGNQANATRMVAYLKEGKREPSRQADLLKNAAQALQEKGARLDPALAQQALDLCGYLLASSQDNDVRVGAELASSLLIREQAKSLITVARDSKRDDGTRVACIQAMGAFSQGDVIATLGDLARDASQTQNLREASVASLGRMLNPQVIKDLAAMLAGSPARLQSSIALALAGTPEGANQLLDSIQQGKASARLLLERPLEVKLKQRNLPGLESRMASLTKGLPPADQLLQEKIQAKRTYFREQKHDLGKGELMFQKHCAACHQVAGKGAKIGPQLDGIGSRGLDRLLEDMLDPNRNVDQAFRQTTLSLKNGQFVNGLVLREEGVLLVLADQQGKEIRVAKDQVEERKLSNVSPMPAGFVDQLSNQEFADLMAYMLANKSMK